MAFDQTPDWDGKVPSNAPPLAVDIDGTLTDDRRAVDPRIFPTLRSWPAPVVLATGKAIPYPVALAEFLRIEPLVVAENGGVVLAERADFLAFEGDPEAATAVATAYRDQGHDLGWGRVDIVNRWRETELAVSRESPLEPLEALAHEHGLEVVDTGFAYHVHSPDVSKGKGLLTLATELGMEPQEFVAIGDSDNDVPLFEVAGTSITPASGSTRAKDATDHVTDAAYSEGFFEAIQWIVDRV